MVGKVAIKYKISQANYNLKIIKDSNRLINHIPE